MGGEADFVPLVGPSQPGKHRGRCPKSPLRGIWRPAFASGPSDTHRDAATPGDTRAGGHHAAAVVHWDHGWVLTADQWSPHFELTLVDTIFGVGLNNFSAVSLREWRKCGHEKFAQVASELTEI